MLIDGQALWLRGRCGRSLSVATALIAVLLSVPPLRSVIEQSMFWHMVVQMPLLVAAGGLLQRAWMRDRPTAFGPWNQYGLTGFLASQMIAAYWMLPLAIDRAVIVAQFDVLKLISLLACGALLAAALARSAAVVQLFFVGTSVSMLIFAGSVILSAEQRLCSAYSLQGQRDAGRGLLVLGVLLGLAWAAWRLWQDRRDASDIRRG